MKLIIKHLTIMSVGLFCLCFVSCSSDAVSDGKDEMNSESDSLSVDSLATQDDVDTLENKYETEEDFLEQLNEETPQLSFCDCVEKQKAIDDKLEAEEEDKKIMALLDEMERMVNNECKILLVSPNTTPDQRKEHERKVRKCLN